MVNLSFTQDKLCAGNCWKRRNVQVIAEKEGKAEKGVLSVEKKRVQKTRGRPYNLEPDTLKQLQFKKSKIIDMGLGLIQGNVTGGINWGKVIWY